MRLRGPVVLGAQVTQVIDQAERGIPRYVADHVESLARLAPDLIGWIDLDPRRRTPTAVERWLTGVPCGAVPRGRASDDARIYHVMSPFDDRPLNDVWPIWARSPRVKLVVTLYDLIPLLYPSFYLRHDELRKPYYARLDMIRQADAVLAISATSASDAIDMLGLNPARVHNISAGSSPFFCRPLTSPAVLCEELRRTLPELRDDFIFCSGGIDPRKNLEGLLAGYALLPYPIRAHRQLVITCRMPAAAEQRLRDLAATLAIGGQVLFTNYVSDRVLRQLYQAAALFVFPSFYEGFGLPVVEALRCGAPVVVHDTPALAELVTDPEARFDGGSPMSIRNVMLRALTDAPFADTLRATAAVTNDAYTWDTVADRTVEVYRSLIDAAVPARRRPRWAIVTPMPPQPTGVADYTALLLPALAEHCDIDVFVDGQPADFDAPADPRVRLRPFSEFRRRASGGTYDRHIYCFGNSDFHVHAWEALQFAPGDVILHDTRLINLYAVLVQRGLITVERFAELFEERGGQVLVPPIRTWDTPALIRAQFDGPAAGVFMNGEVLRRADRVIVHTRAARTLALLGVPEAEDRLSVCGLPIPTADPSPRSDGPPVICTFGIFHGTKGADALIAAFSRVLADRPDASLVFVGDGYPPLRDQLSSLAASLGCDHAVQFTGRVSRDEYRQWMRAATIAVQLRVTTHGEMSGAVCDCLAAGVPTMVSAIGGFNELPRDAVVLVPNPLNETVLAEAIADLLNDRARQETMRVRAREYAAAHSAAQVAADWLRVLGPAHVETAPRPELPVAAARPRKVVQRLEIVLPRRAAAIAPTYRRAHRVQTPAGVAFTIVVDERAKDPISLACPHGIIGNPLIDLMLQMTTPGARVLDIGGHIGSFSLAAAAAGREVLSIEASPENAALLKESIAVNGFTNLRLVQAAASDRPGSVGFWSLGPWGHVATVDMPSDRMVPARRIDDVLAEVGWDRVDFVKIDVEGSEVAVLRGMTGLLSRPEAPLLLFESNAHTLAFFNLTPRDLLAEVELLGYRSYAVEENELWPMRPDDLQPTLLVDYLATTGVLTSTGTWGVTPAPGIEELLARAAAECDHASEEHRRYIARALQATAAAHHLHPAVTAGLQRLALDPVESVRAAAAWSTGQFAGVGRISVR